MTTRDPRRWNNCHDKKQRAWNLPFLLLTAMFVWFSTSTSLAQIDAVFSSTPAVCEDGTGTITCVSITGGVPPYSCQINCGSCTSNDPTWTLVPPGTYTAVISDANSSQANFQILVGHLFPTPINASITTNPSACNGSTGSACAVVTGGTGTSFTYEWVNNLQPSVVLSTAACVNNASAGQYGLRVVDATSLCTKNFNVTIQQAALSLTSTVTDTQCAGADCQGNVLCTGSMTLVPAGTAPYTIVWSDGFVGNGLTRTGMCPGTYTATVTDANGCSASVTNTIGLANAQVQWNSTYTSTALNPALPPVAGFPVGQSVHFITGNVTWNPTFFNGLNTINTACHIVVAAGAQLTINDLVVRMPQGSTIRVLAQGRLIANNSTFEPGCGTTWRGFEVLGINATNTSQRGNLELNGCKVTKASIGIVNFSFDANIGSIPVPFNTNNTVATCGGRVKATNTQFIDNRIDVRLAHLPLDIGNATSCEFNGCLFSLTQLPINCDGVGYSLSFLTHGRVMLHFCQNVLFNGCQFENLNPAHLGTFAAPNNFPALRTTSSSFTVRGTPSTNPDNYTSSFIGFRNGVVSTRGYAPGYITPSTEDIVIIENTLFQSFTGIWCDGLLDSEYIGNWFTDMPLGFNHASATPRLLSRLLWTDGATPKYLYQNNVHVNIQNQVNTTGLTILNGGPNNNYVVGNVFDGMGGASGIVKQRAGMVLEGRNRQGLAGGGLRYECNTFENNDYDVFIGWAGSVGWEFTGPASIQRQTWPNLPSSGINSAGNKFGDSMSPLSMDDIQYTVQSSAQPFFGNGVCQYWYHPSELNTNLTSEMTDTYSWPLNVETVGGFVNSCEVAVQIDEISLNQVSQKLDIYETQKENYTDFIDDGNTEGILTTITTEAGTANWDLYTFLTNKAEVLSDEVLLRLANELSFPTVLLIDLLATVPGAGRNERLIKALELTDRNISASDWQAIFNTNQFGSEKTEKEASLADVKLAFDRARLQLSREELVAWETNVYNGHTEVWRLPFESIGVCQKKWAFGEEPTTVYMSKATDEMERIGLGQVWSEYQWLQQLRSEALAREEVSLTPQEIEELEQYYYAAPLAQGLAAYILLAEFGHFLEDPTTFANQSGDLRSSFQATEPSITDISLLYPNPCEEYTVVETDDILYYDAHFTVMDITGKAVLNGSIRKGKKTTVLDTSELPNGVYFLELTFLNVRSTQVQQKFIKQ